METLINTPSTVGYYKQIHPVLEDIAGQLGCEVAYDNRHTAYIQVPGLNPNKTIALSAHLDTIGLIVRSIDDNGWLSVRNLGGVNFHSLEGENVRIHTRFDGDYTGTILCKAHSVHVFDDARELERSVENMKILIDEDVKTKDDVLALGIRPGDAITPDPRFVLTDTGYVKSRYVDDKACAAVLLECLAQIKENNMILPYNTLFVFPMHEEIGVGATWLPQEVDEFVALDIGLTGGCQSGNEKKVTICAADRIAPYDWDLTTKLIDLADKNSLDYAVDIFYRYSSDATHAISGGQNVRPALIGMGVVSSHGYERTHLHGIEQLFELTMAYITSK